MGNPERLTLRSLKSVSERASTPSRGTVWRQGKVNCLNEASVSENWKDIKKKKGELDK